KRDWSSDVCSSDYSLRDLERRKAFFAERDDVRLRRGLAGLQDHEYLDGLAAVRVRDADRGRLSDGRMHEEDLLDFSRVHVVARAEDHVLLAIDDVEISVLVHSREIAREQPSVAEHRRGLLRLVPVAIH